MCTVWRSWRTCWMKEEDEHCFFHGFSLLPSSPVATKMSCVMATVHRLSSPQLITQVTRQFGSFPPVATATNFTRHFLPAVLVEKASAAWENDEHRPAFKNLCKWNIRKVFKQIINRIWSVFLKENWFCSENAKTASFRDLLDFTKVSPQSETLVKAVIQQPALRFSRLKFSSVKCFHLSLTGSTESVMISDDIWKVVISDTDSSLVRLWRGSSNKCNTTASECNKCNTTASEKGKGGGGDCYCNFNTVTGTSWCVKVMYFIHLTSFVIEK